MGETVCDVVANSIGGWLNKSTITFALGTPLLSWGAYLVASQNVTSTFFCSSRDRSLLVVCLQWAGLLLDGAIIVLSWRILAWTRTTKIRLKTLSSILLASAIGTGLLYWSSRLCQTSKPMSYHFRGLDSLYLFDIVVDGFTFSICLISTSLLVTERKPVSLVGVVTFLSAAILSVQKIKAIGSWENVSPVGTSLTLGLICLGFSFFVYTNLRSVAIIYRFLFVFIISVVVIATTIVSIIKGQRVLNNHPLQRLIYDSRVGADRWLVHATTSNSLPIAVQEYRERHNGRDPPAKFDVWYNFATKHNSPIIDYFPQIETDLRPFWGMSPAKIRQDTHSLASDPGIALVKIQSGLASHNIPANSPHKASVDDLVGMISTFAQHIPDMELAINLDDRPRVLAPWDDVYRSVEAGKHTGLSKLLSKRVEGSDEKLESPAQHVQQTNTDGKPLQDGFTPIRALREMTALTCPPGTKTRAGVHWDIRDFCPACAKPQSQGQYLTNWSLSQELCHQPDLLRLHGFHASSPTLRPLQELAPIFSRSKTGRFSDILIPLRRVGEQDQKDDGKEFSAKLKTLFWRGSVERNGITTNHHDLLHGGHQERLVHLVNNKVSRKPHGKTTLMLPTPKNNDKFTYQQLSTSYLNTLLPIDIAFSNYTAANKDDILISPASSDSKSDSHNPPELAHQYILTIDTDSSPPPNLLSVLRSKSVPFYGTIFKEWHTERLAPWVHFVPVDLRWHALHGTLAYFSGINLEDRRDSKGRGDKARKGNWRGMASSSDDGKWIAEEGMKWARKALRREDMEVYLFRLLLEWARVVSDDREGMGFVV